MSSKFMGSMLRGMLIPTFLEKRAREKTLSTDFLFQFEKFYFNFDRLFNDSLVSNSIGYYLFLLLSEKTRKIKVILSKKRSHPLAKSIERIFYSYGYTCEKLILPENNNKPELSQSIKERIRDKEVCFVDNISLDRAEINQIQDFAERAGASIISYISIFNYAGITNPLSIISLFDRKKMERYNLLPFKI